jgi:Predicted membrane protein
MNTAHVGKTLHHIVENIVNVFKEGANLATNYSDAAYDKWKQDAGDVFKDTGTDSAEEARSQAKERLTEHLMDGGMSKGDAEKWFEDRWKDAVDSAEKIRHAMPKVEAGAKLVWLKFVGAVTAIFTGALIVSVINSGPTREQRAALDLLARTQMEQEQVQRLSAIVLSDDEFNMLTGSLFVPSAPAPVEMPAPVAAQAAPAPALPAAIAAVAAEPVQVREESSSGEVHTIATTVGSVYTNSPPSVRRAMEASPPPPPIDHGYDHEDKNDCFHTDCLGAIDKQFHKQYTITNGDGSASISVSVQH